MMKLEKELKQVDRSKVCLSVIHTISGCLIFVFKMLYVLLVKFQDEQYRNKIKQLNQRQLSLIKASMDFVVAIGLLQLAPKKITPRVTGALGFVTSLISCYQVALTNQP